MLSDSICNIRVEISPLCCSLPPWCTYKCICHLTHVSSPWSFTFDSREISLTHFEVKAFLFLFVFFYFLKQHWRSLSLPSQTLWPSSEEFRWGAGEMTKQWRALAHLSEDHSSNTVTHMAAHSHLYLQSQVIMLPQVVYKHTLGQNTHTHFFFLKKKELKKSPGTSRIQSRRQAGLLTEQGRVFTLQWPRRLLFTCAF